MSSAAQPPHFHVTEDYISGLSGQTNHQLNAARRPTTSLRRERRSSNPFAFVRPRKPSAHSVVTPASDASQKQQWDDFAPFDASTQQWNGYDLSEQVSELANDCIALPSSDISPRALFSLHSAQFRGSLSSGSSSWASSFADSQTSSPSGPKDPVRICESICETPVELPGGSSRSSIHSKAGSERFWGFDCPIRAGPGGQEACPYKPRAHVNGIRDIYRVREHVGSHGLLCKDCQGVFEKWTHFRAHREHSNKSGICPTGSFGLIKKSSSHSKKLLDLSHEDIVRFFTEPKVKQDHDEQWLEGYKILHPLQQNLPSPFYTKNTTASSQNSNDSLPKWPVSDLQSRSDLQVYQPAIPHSTPEGTAVLSSSWLEGSRLTASPTEFSVGLNDSLPATEEPLPYVTQSSYATTADNGSSWILPGMTTTNQIVPDCDLTQYQPQSSAFGTDHSSLDTRDRSYGTSHLSSLPVAPEPNIPWDFTSTQQQELKKPIGALARLKLRIPGMAKKGYPRPASQSSFSVMQSVEQSRPPTSPIWDKHLIQETLSSRPVPNLKRGWRTISTSSRASAAKKQACGPLDRANSLNKLRNLQQKLFAAEGERDQVVQFVREFQQEVEKWDFEDEQAGEVQDLINIFNVGVEQIRHLLG